MRHKPVWVVLNRRFLVDKEDIRHRRTGCILHATKDKVMYDDLVIPWPGIINAGLLAKRGDHLWRLAKGAHGVGLFALWHEVSDGERGVLSFKGRQFRYNRGEQVRWHRLTLLEVGDCPPLLFCCADLLAIRQ